MTNLALVFGMDRFYLGRSPSNQGRSAELSVVDELQSKHLLERSYVQVLTGRN